MVLTEKSKTTPAKSKRLGDALHEEPANKKSKSSKTTQSPKDKGKAKDVGEVSITFPADSSVRNKDGWDKVYSELPKLEFEYDKAALESLGKKNAFEKAIRHQMKVKSPILRIVNKSGIVYLVVLIKIPILSVTTSSPPLR